MDRLWVRLSLAIGALFFVVLGLLAVIIIGASMMRLVPPIIDDSRPNMHNIWRELPEGFLGLLVVTGTIGTLSGILVSRILSAPLIRLATAARQIGEGDLSTRITLRGSREIKDLAESFNNMAAELEEAEVLRSNLMADVSHELRTPLTALEGNLRAALDHVYELDEEELAHLYGQTRHLIRLVNDLRELALAEAHNLPLDIQQIDIGKLVSETVSTFEPLAQEQEIGLTYSQGQDLPQAQVDEVRIRQVLHNLIDNALRHTPASGSIAITAEALTPKAIRPAPQNHQLQNQPQNHHSQNKSKRSVRLTITDTGQGISPEQLPHVFDRFYRMDKSRARETGGTGLGLAIVKAIVEEHGGVIKAHSKGHNRGASFQITL